LSERSIPNSDRAIELTDNHADRKIRRVHSSSESSDEWTHMI
jgi:hypothetical protein